MFDHMNILYYEPFSFVFYILYFFYFRGKIYSGTRFQSCIWSGPRMRNSFQMQISIICCYNCVFVSTLMSWTPFCRSGKGQWPWSKPWTGRTVWAHSWSWSLSEACDVEKSLFYIFISKCHNLHLLENSSKSFLLLQPSCLHSCTKCCFRL